MNKGILAFLFGAAIGGVATGLVMKQRFDIILEEEIQEVRDFWRANADEIEDEEAPEEEEEPSNPISSIYDTIPKEEQVKYNKPVMPVKKSIEELMFEKNRHVEEVISEEFPEDDEPEEEEMEEFENIVRVEGEPHIINSQMFDSENAHYDKLTITYYREDDTYADERDDFVPDAGRLIGYDVVENIDNYLDDTNVVYIRNDSMTADVELLCVDGSFSEIVLGILPTGPGFDDGDI